MKVNFVALQTNGKETREYPLFSEDWPIIRIGKRVKANGILFQIDRLQWVNREAGIIKAICKQFRYPGQKDCINY